NVDPREADPARISVEDFQSAVTRLKSEGGVEARVEARQQEGRQHLWQYALALMAGLLAVGGVLAARTARRERSGEVRGSVFGVRGRGHYAALRSYSRSTPSREAAVAGVVCHARGGSRCALRLGRDLCHRARGAVDGWRAGGADAAPRGGARVVRRGDRLVPAAAT